MINRWLTWASCVIISLVGVLLISMGILWLTSPRDIVDSDLIHKQSTLPNSAFSQSSESYNAIAGPFLLLENAPPTLQLPDLKSHLTYIGRNGRPDAIAENVRLHFQISGNKKGVSTAVGERTYLMVEKGSRPLRYIFSPNNEKTSLWITAAPTGNNEILISVGMEGNDGQIVTVPENFREFRVPEKELIKGSGEIWEIGQWRADGTLLARQRAKWTGGDRFLEKHGGKHFTKCTGKQRVDFGEGDQIYSLFMQLNDYFVWDLEKNQWREPLQDEETHQFPLLVVKKIDDRLMSFELWDVEGKGKVILNLLKSNEPWSASNTQLIQQTFKFVGAKTRTQCLFEINKVRMVIKPSDWLLLTPQGWKKLEKPEEIDDYVQRRSTGMLFVFEELARRNDKQVIVGNLYNPSRSDCQPVEITVQQVNPKSNPKRMTRDKIRTSSDEDDDEDDDEEEEEELEAPKKVLPASRKMEKIPPSRATEKEGAQIPQKVGNQQTNKNKV